MADRERVASIISEVITAEVELTQFNEIVGGPADEDGDYAVNVGKIGETAAARLEAEGLLT